MDSQLCEAPLSAVEVAKRPRAENLEDDEELLAECLGKVAAARQRAAALLVRFGSLSGALSACAEAITSTPGLTMEDAAALQRAHRLVIRLCAAKVGALSVISSWAALLDYVRAGLRHERREQFRILFLDKRNGLIRDEVLGYGSIDHAPVYPREVMRRALELSASNLILVHNHPGGDPTPSGADVQITRQVVDAGRALGIRVYDHLVVGRTEVASFRALGLLVEP